MKKLLLFFYLFILTNLYPAKNPVIIQEPIKANILSLAFHWVDNRLTKLENQIKNLTGTTATTTATDHNHQALEILYSPVNNISSMELQSVCQELDNEKLHRKSALSVLYNTMETNLLLGGSVNTTTNLGIGADTTPSYPIQIDRKAPQIVIKNSAGEYSWGLSVPESTENKSFNIQEIGVGTRLTISPPSIDDTIFFNLSKLTLGSGTVNTKCFQNQNYGISFSSGMNILGKQLYLSDLSRYLQDNNYYIYVSTSLSVNTKLDLSNSARYFSDDNSNYEIDLSTSLNIAGKLNVKDITTLSSATLSGNIIVDGEGTIKNNTYLSTFTASGYGVVNGTFTVEKMTYCSSATFSGNVGIGTAASEQLAVFNNSTSTSGYSFAGHFNAHINPSVTPAADTRIYGLYSRGRLLGGQNIEAIIGGALFANHFGTGTATSQIGLHCGLLADEVANSTTTTINATVIDSHATKSGGGNWDIGTYKGIDVQKPVISSGSINGTTIYGLYLDDFSLDGGTWTNRYSIYSAGGKNYFNGNVGIGMINSNAKLNIEESGSETYSLTVGTSPITVYDLVVTTLGKVGIGTAVPKAFGLQIAHNNPQIALSELDQTTDEKNWDFMPQGKSLYGRVVNDAYTDAANWLQVNRGTGYTVNTIVFPTGNVGIGESNPTSQLYVSSWTSSLGYIDRTPYPKTKDEAYRSILSMQNKADGSGLDHHKLDPFVLHIATKTYEKYNKITKSSETVSEIEYGRNLSATVSAQNEVIKDLIKRIEILEKK